MEKYGITETGKIKGGGCNTGIPCKHFFAVIDSYHEALSPMVAIFPTYRAAEECMAGRIKEDRQKGNRYSYYIAPVMAGWDMAADEPGIADKTVPGDGRKQGL